MPNKKSRLLELGIIGLICIASVMVYLLSRLFSTTSLIDKVLIVVHIASCVFGFFYAISGYSKKAATNYKAFMLLYTISTFINTYNVFQNPNFSPVPKIACVIGAIISLILTFVKNLGKTRSVYLILLIMIMDIVLLVLVLANADVPYQFILDSIEGAVLTAFVCVFISAKYNDKDARGTI